MGRILWNHMKFLKDLAIILLFAKCFGILRKEIQGAAGSRPDYCRAVSRSLCVRLDHADRVYHRNGGSRRNHINVFCRIGIRLEGAFETGPIAFLIACAGVLVPLVFGSLLYMGFYGVAPWGSENFFKAVFMGTIMTVAL